MKFWAIAIKAIGTLVLANTGKHSRRTRFFSFLLVILPSTMVEEPSQSQESESKAVSDQFLVFCSIAFQKQVANLVHPPSSL